MSGGGRAPVSSRSAQPILQPLGRHHPLSSPKPPFRTPEDYHHFSSGSGESRLASAGDVNEAIVMKSPVSSLLFFL